MTTQTQTEALKLALEALDFSTSPSPCVEELQDDAIAAIKEALAQPASYKQELSSVTYKEVADTMNALYAGDSKQVQIAMALESKKLYTTPPIPTAQPKEPEQEPVAYFNATSDGKWEQSESNDGVPFYASCQPQPEQEPVPAAMKTVIEAMQQDPDYAWGWHCNIAMSFVDAGGDHYTGNQGAARFMRTLANVEPAHELPFSPPQRKPLTDEQIAQALKHYGDDIDPSHEFWKGIAKAIEAAHGIKE